MSTWTVDEDLAARDAAALLRALHDAGAADGDVIAVLAGNGPAAVAARDAATAGDMVLAPINPRLASPEIEQLLEHVGPRAFLTDRAHAMAGAIVIDDAIARGGGSRSRGDLRDLYATRAGATLLFTSGTTGRAKACLRTSAQDGARLRELTASYALTRDDVHLIACPLAHSAPGIFLRACRGAGARTHVSAQFRAEAFLDDVRTTRATVFFLVPTQWQRLLALPEAQRRAADWSSVRAAVVAGAPIAPETKAAIIDWIGPGKLWEFYGSSETGTVTVIGPDEHALHPGSVGRAPAGVSIRLEGELGEVFVRSPALMEGYLQSDGSVQRHGGEVSVGDLGRLDGDWLTLVDRKFDTIISGGVNVYPAEVERALAAHPGVRGAVVFGVADPDWGESVAAVVAGDVAPDELLAFLRARIAAYKLPRAIARCALDELPIGASGKPLRRIARERFAAELVTVRRGS